MKDAAVAILAILITAPLALSLRTMAGTACFGAFYAAAACEEKNNREQIEMCFDAYHSPNWKTLID